MATIDISDIVEKYANIIGKILPVHALTGCDTVACCYGVGKGTALKVLKAGVHCIPLQDTSEFIRTPYNHYGDDSNNP
jgi:hypothetical protein